MKDDKGRELPEYDIDKLIEEYSDKNRTNGSPRSAASDDFSDIRKNSVSGFDPDRPVQPAPKKKFVVHIDESLIDMPDSRDEKPSSGGIYFSNYQKKRSQQSSSSDRAASSKTSAGVGYSASAADGKDGRIKKTAKAIRNRGGKTAAAFLAFIVIATGIFSYIGISCINDMLAINRKEDVVSVNIPENSDCGDILNILKDNGLIRQKTFCKAFTKYRGFDKNTYLSGVYYLNAKMGVEGMLREVMAAPVEADTITLSFPEGWTTQQIFEKLEKHEVCDSSKLYTAMMSADFSYSFINNITDKQSRYLKLEGYLFPDTYDFYVDADTNYVIKKFLGNFADKWTPEYDARAEKLGYTMDEVITIASIVQKEAANSEQMKTIASILYNRLSDPANYPTLGCDSTAIYISNYVTPVVGEAQGSYYYSQYNTSAVKGLPPGPICNPGMDAIKAALYPADTDYYYFAHDENGKIYLSKTFKEHKNNLVKIIKENNEH
ncbi:MAG: endolytic transglycosylase MltG [Clostridia bacterium]|nr:endolytic transglycosylase MltG [Clostridia bacterium]